MGSHIVLACFPLCRDTSPPSVKMGEMLRLIQCRLLCSQIKNPHPGRKIFGQPRVFELRQLGQGRVGATYQYCPPESTRYISSEDSLR